jgi:hypothetical protein
MDEKQAIRAYWGMYGLRVEGFERPQARLCQVPASWPVLTVAQPGPDDRRRPPGRRPGHVYAEDGRAEVWLGDDSRIEIDRATMAVEVRSATPFGDDALAHPFLGLPAAVANRWLGRQVLHGGAFVAGDGAVGLLGTKEAGKSSTLARLREVGAPILSDDLLVLEGQTLFSGPRCIDLRPESGARLGGEDLGVVGGRPRWRLPADQVAPAHRVAGLVHLAWGDDIAVERIEPGARLVELFEHVVFRMDAGDDTAYLDLATLPAWRLVRPRRLDRLDEAVDQLLATLEAS